MLPAADGTGTQLVRQLTEARSGQGTAGGAGHGADARPRAAAGTGQNTRLAIAAGRGIKVAPGLDDVAHLVARRDQLEDAAIHLPIAEALCEVGVMPEIGDVQPVAEVVQDHAPDRKSTRLNSSH